MITLSLTKIEKEELSKLLAKTNNPILQGITSKLKRKKIVYVYNQGAIIKILREGFKKRQNVKIN